MPVSVATRSAPEASRTTGEPLAARREPHASSFRVRSVAQESLRPPPASRRAGESVERCGQRFEQRRGDRLTLHGDAVQEQRRDVAHAAALRKDQSGAWSDVDPDPERQLGTRGSLAHLREDAGQLPSAGEHVVRPFQRDTMDPQHARQASQTATAARDRDSGR